MKIVIVGDGKVGFALTQQLAREDHDIVVIDSNKMVLKESQQMVDIQVVHGNGASPVVQSAASVGESDLMIAATSAMKLIFCAVLWRKSWDAAIPLPECGIRSIMANSFC